MMAGDEDCDRYQNQRGNQTASPPTILFQHLSFETIETRLQRSLRYFSLISRAS
jgi:hypothetical protein